MLQSRLPLRLTHDVSLQSVGQETLIYDETRHQAFCLDPIASAVWKQCDGQHTIAQIAEGAGLELGVQLPEESVHIALARFEADHLLESQAVRAAEIPLALLATQSRRTLIARLGASAALMIPVVAMVVTPKAAQAYSGCVNCLAAPPQSPVRLDSRPSSEPAASAPPSRRQLYTDDLR